MVQLEICISNSHELFTTMLRFEASFTTTPRAASKTIPNSNWVLRPQPEKPSAGDFEDQTTKPPREAYLLCLLHDLNKCHHCPRSPNHQVL